VLILLLPFFLYGDSKSSHYTKVKTRTIQVKPILKLTDLKLNTEGWVPFFDSFFDVDQNGDFYFIEGANHRILKFSPQKKLICQIGSIGQADDDLYYPCAIFVDCNSILVGDHGGKKIKRFSLSGQFISAYPIKDCVQLNTIRVGNGNIYCDARYETDDWHKRKAISIFNTNGNFMKEIGKSLKTQDWVSYRIFNAAIFQVKNNQIYGTYKCYPVIFKYDLEGRIIFYLNLGEMSIPEIDEISKQVREGSFDTPGEKKSKKINVVRGTQYCMGFDVDENSHLYYALGSTAGLHLILHLDSNGKLLEKIILEKDNHIVKIRGLYIRESIRYGIGYLERFGDDAFLFVF
ncbi:MAG: hypothetical protein JSV88_15150, partial [Candidatus Aminicenantes bacterium]